MQDWAIDKAPGGLILSETLQQTYVLDLAPLFRLESLRQLHLKDLSAFDREEGRGVAALRRVIPQRCNNIEELHLKHSLLHMEILGILVASPRSLKMLEYDVTLECIIQELDAQLALGTTKLSRALHPQKACLKSLYLSCDARAEDETRGVINLHGVLQDFIALEYLSCPLTSVVDTRLGASATFIDSLPPSLLTYKTVIRKYTKDQDCLAALERVVASRQTHAHRLENIHIVIVSPAPWFTYNRVQLVESFSQTAINLVVEDEPDEDEYSDIWGMESTNSSRPSDEIDLYSDAD
ncbi:hypothetical protein N0V83_009456 [Neocucurbitaria cava]|uniref:Uncharacterized protein n=1 Tax=Neocucurbitaria cava TaxID=798079 RepID=A0A9W8Y248_9PLEO|nr:hypothetical protein N0V83_009456 [Neocucurbitaria cava]